MAATGETSFVTDQTSAVAAGKDNLGQTEISMDFTESVEIPDMPELGTYVIELCRDSTADNCVFFSMLGATDVISSVPFEDNLETDNGNGEEYIPDVEDELETYDSSDEEYVPANDEHRSDNVL